MSHILELHLRPRRDLNSRPLKPTLQWVASALTTRPCWQDKKLTFKDEQNLACWLRTSRLFRLKGNIVKDNLGGSEWHTLHRYCKTRKHGALQKLVPLAQLPRSIKIYGVPMVLHLYSFCLMFQNNNFCHFFNTGKLVPFRNFRRSILFVYILAQVNCLGNRVSSAN